MSEISEDFLNKFREKIAAQELGRYLGTKLEEVGPGHARVSMVCRPDMLNILGMVHGAAVFALIDEAFQASCNAYGRVAVALNLSITFHAGPQVGDTITAQAREVHATRRTATYAIDVTGPGERLLATCQALAYRKDQPLPFI